MDSQFIFQCRQDNKINIFTLDDDGRNLTQITDSPTRNFDPSVSPDGKWIVFIASGKDNDEVHMMRLDGTERSSVIVSPSVCINPCFSPDGQRIAYVKAGQQGWAIHIVNCDGTDEKQVISGNVPYYPVFTTEGNHIIYGEGTLFIVETNGSRNRRLFKRRKGDYEKVAIHPNGKDIAFVEVHCHSTENEYEYRYTYDVLTADLAGSRIIKVSNSVRSANSPTFSPDGKRIAFIGEASEEHPLYIYTADLDGSDLKRIEVELMGASYLSWAPM